VPWRRANGEQTPAPRREVVPSGRRDSARLGALPVSTLAVAGQGDTRPGGRRAIGSGLLRGAVQQVGWARASLARCFAFGAARPHPARRCRVYLARPPGASYARWQADEGEAPATRPEAALSCSCTPRAGPRRRRTRHVVTLVELNSHTACAALAKPRGRSGSSVFTPRLRAGARARGSVSAARAPAVLHAPDSLSFRLAKIMGVLPRRKLEWGRAKPLAPRFRRVPRS
jgi:hypothetical protein